MVSIFPVVRAFGHDASVEVEEFIDSRNGQIQVAGDLSDLAIIILGSHGQPGQEGLVLAVVSIQRGIRELVEIPPDGQVEVVYALNSSPTRISKAITLTAKPAPQESTRSSL